MKTMKEVCMALGIGYETLRFYCNEGLVPNVKRDINNYRLFDEKDIAWIKSLQALRKCGMSIIDMKKYMNLCIEGKTSINKRKEMLNRQNEILLRKQEELLESMIFIKNKQQYFDDIESGKIEYSSNLIDCVTGKKLCE